MKKGKIIIPVLLSLTAMPILAQSDWEVQNVRPRRCGTSMMIEREAAAAKANGQKRVISSSQRYVPHSGTLTIPVILVNFSDVKLSVTTPQQAFDQFFNGTTQTAMGNGNQYNHGSVAQYFSDMSGGSYSLSFKVYAPVTVSHPETYYGGSNNDSNSDEHPEWLVKDAVDALVASGQVGSDDATSFSRDGSTIDCVYIIYAGCGQNYGGDGTTVWANTWNHTNGAAIGGKSVRWYSMAGELSPAKVDGQGNQSNDGTIPMITGVGVTCHELSHAMGLPDFYPVDSPNAEIDNQEMEYWDLMDGGEYTYNGFCPTAYTAFEKNEMGWSVNIETLAEDRAVSIDNSTEKGGTAYKIVNPQNSNEYFMLECIQQRGWNRHLFGNGLLVYHVNRPAGDMTSATRFNNTANYPGMAVVPADGVCMSSYIDANMANNGSYYRKSLYGDLFPGYNPDTLNVTELSDAQPQPNFCWYNSAKTQKLQTNKALRNITYNSTTGVVAFNYINNVSAGISNVKADKATDNRIYTIDGRYAGNDLNALPRGIYIKDGKKVTKF